ncbi:hypothetical protein L596_000446 [Steinernema carpocapsae]|uniref:Uncharacterized protein n=1 Tax=Steinernema carpocapsae TaxID=34508 RepID=A0A4U8UJJ6_STECR|nr:hypothetical protein L596_000446 [Steinernema carpocapsae]
MTTHVNKDVSLQCPHTEIEVSIRREPFDSVSKTVKALKFCQITSFVWVRNGCEAKESTTSTWPRQRLSASASFKQAEKPASTFHLEQGTKHEKTRQVQKMVTKQGPSVPQATGEPEEGSLSVMGDPRRSARIAALGAPAMEDALELQKKINRPVYENLAASILEGTADNEQSAELRRSARQALKNTQANEAQKGDAPKLRRYELRHSTITSSGAQKPQVEIQKSLTEQAVANSQTLYSSHDLPKKNQTVSSSPKINSGHNQKKGETSRSSSRFTKTGKKFVQKSSKRPTLPKKRQTTSKRSGLATRLRGRTLRQSALRERTPGTRKTPVAKKNPFVGQLSVSVPVRRVRLVAVKRAKQSEPQKSQEASKNLRSKKIKIIRSAVSHTNLESSVQTRSASKMSQSKPHPDKNVKSGEASTSRLSGEQSGSDVGKRRLQAKRGAQRAGTKTESGTEPRPETQTRRPKRRASKELVT